MNKMESLRMPFAAWFFIWFAVCEIWIVSADLPDEPSFRQKRSLVHGTTCPKGTFAKDLFCVKRCGPGLYGNIKTWTCEECSKQCRTCSDGTRNDICTSCLNPYYLSDGVCLALCRAGTLSQGPPLRNMRLIGGQTQFEGRLEVYKFGSWGTVCDDGWDILDASVVCRELMLGEALEAVTMAGMGQGSPSQKIHLSGVACNGNETRLDACAHAPWEHNGCGHFEDVGVRCSGPDLTRRCVRSCGAGYYLVAGRQKCDTCDSSCLTCANSSDSCLTCDKPLFLSGNKCLDVCGDGYYGDATSRKCLRCDPICRTCSGNPSNCTSCPFTPDRYLFNNTCLLDCGKTHVIEYATLRLSGKRSSPYEGRVEVLRGDDWLTICDETFDFREATVVCRQLGMGRAIKSVRNAGFGAGKGRIWVDKLYCTGGESNIFDCPMKQMHWNSECYHVNDAGVICSGPQTGSPMSNTCRRSCQEGYYKNDLDICKKCSSQCAACIGTSQRCTKCSAPKFLLKNSCVTQCTAAQYGNTVTRECSPCDTSVCVTCANGPNGRNCSSCVAPRALKDGECMDTCAPDLYEKSGKCVSDCGEEFYQYAGNNTCLACPSECFRCVYEASLGKPRCTSCKPPKVFQNNACNNNCTADQVSVPVLDRIGSATIRLVNGSDYLEGRVEVFYNGEWGTVCDDSWDSKETTVVCRQLNLGEPALKPLGTIAKGTGRIWLDDMWCIGGETSLQQCRHRKWGETNCNHNEDVAIRCKGPGIRRCAEKCPDGQYARDTLCQMCDQSCATCVDTGTKCLKCASGYYLNGTNQCLKDCGPGYYLNGAQTKCLKCDSNCATCEESSTKCTSCQPPNFRLGNKCQADCGAGYKPAPTHGIRLVNGKTSLQGRVEVLFNNKWGTVCDDGFDLRDATVICRMLNFGNATAYHTAGYFGRGTGDTWLDDLECTGNENTLSKCKHRGWGIENCEHSEDAGVTCAGPDTSQDCIMNCGPGFYKNESARTCGKCSSDCKACEVYPDNCTECAAGEFLNKSDVRMVCVQDCGTGFFPQDKMCVQCASPCFTCSGTADNCTGCGSNQVLNNNKCQKTCGADSIVSGVSDIRLVGTNSTFEGRIEIMYQGAWGTVCDDGFDLNDATVACRHLKLGKALSFKGAAAYGAGNGKIVMDDLQCKNTEKSLFECKQHPAGVGHSNCGHAEDVGVRCSGPDMSKKCVKDCPSGFYDDNHVCKRCDQNCKECIGAADRCIKCDLPNFLNQQTNKCVDKCPLGNYGNTKSRTCWPCSSKCQTCMNGETDAICKSCSPGLFLYDSQCITHCGDMQSVADLLPTRPAVPTVRLVGGRNKQEGRVEILHEGVWGTVCDDDWDVKDASVVCRELGFGKALRATKHAEFGKGEGMIWADNVDCYGYESSLSQCRNHGWGVNNCDLGHGEDAGVVCDNSTIEDVANNYCRKVIKGKCQDSSLCYNGVTCVDLELLTNKQIEGSICLQCPDGYMGDGELCRVIASIAPEFQVQPANNITTTTESAFRIGCRSVPPVVTPIISDWLKDGKPIDENDVKSLRITTDTSGQLVVNNVQRSDFGNYTCVLKNSAGSISASTIVTVNEAPRVVDFSPSLLAKGQTAYIYCNISSYPTANITWKRNGAVLKGSRYNVFTNNFTLAIYNAVFEDSGQYECTAQNWLGTASANVSVSVGMPSSIATAPSKTVVNPSQRVTLKCNATGQPQPVVTWKKDGVTIKTGPNRVVEPGTLTIGVVSRADTGMYACIAQNPQNIATVFSSVIVSGPPIINRPPQNISVLTGANVSFLCQAMGSPPPVFTWYHNGKEKNKDIPSPGTEVVKEKLTLKGVTIEDAGTIRCEAVNEFGTASSTAFLLVDGEGEAIVLGRTSPDKSTSTGTIVAVVVILLAVILVIGIVVFCKYWRNRHQATAGYRYEIGGDSGKPGRLTQLKLRMSSGASNPMGTDPVDNFDDNKPFVDHEAL